MMTERARARIGLRVGTGLVAAMLLPVALIAGARFAAAQETVTLSITLQDRKFDPPELHAPAGKPIAIRVKNLNPIVSEFESSDLHFEKIVPAGREAVVYVHPLQPGRYNFYDDFHHETQGYLVVP
jgi:heme/copper-type cytochrome/quinol oxidase subunit 2